MGSRGCRLIWDVWDAVLVPHQVTGQIRSCAPLREDCFPPVVGDTGARHVLATAVFTRSLLTSGSPHIAEKSGAQVWFESRVCVLYKLPWPLMNLGEERRAYDGAVSVIDCVL